MFPKLLAFTLSANILHCHPLGSCVSKHKGYSGIKIHCTFLTSVISLTPMDSPVYCRCTAHFGHCRQLMLHWVSSLGAPGQREASWQGTPFLLLVQELMLSLGPSTHISQDLPTSQGWKQQSSSLAEMSRCCRQASAIEENLPRRSFQHRKLRLQFPGFYVVKGMCVTSNNLRLYSA